MKHRLLSAEQRVAEASQSAFALAIDALHDPAIQEALFRRNAAITWADAEREELLSSILDHGRPNRETYLIEMLRTDDATIRDAAIYALVDIHSVAGGAAIVDIVSSRQIKDSLTAALYALNKLNISLDIEQFVRLVIEATVEVRYECLLLLEKGCVIYSGKLALKRAIHILQLQQHLNRKTDYLKQIIEALTVVAASLR